MISRKTSRKHYREIIIMVKTVKRDLKTERQTHWNKKNIKRQELSLQEIHKNTLFFPVNTDTK
jgi:hypothetical protein